MSNLSWNQPMCERCWTNERFVWGPSTNPDHPDHEQLLEAPIPHRVVTDEPEVRQCAYCGSATFVGIFVRDDPAKVPYPHEKGSDL